MNAKNDKILILMFRFLKDRNLFIKIINNIKKRPNKFGKELTLPELFNNAINHIPNSPLRSRRIGFDWDASFEGYDFWNNVHTELEKFFKKTNI